jgi:hypothetical protein
VRWKREAFEQSLADYYEVKVVFVDHQALVVPESARPNPGGDEILRMIGGVDAEFLAGKMQSLAYGLNMAKPIEDLQVDDTGIHATLSFGGLGWHKTFVPWEAVLGLRCERPRPKAKPQLRSV